MCLNQGLNLPTDLDSTLLSLTAELIKKTIKIQSHGKLFNQEAIWYK